MSMSDLINLDDYKILKFYIVCFNNTSTLSILDYTKIDFTEFGESSMTITLPRGACSIGHSITLYVAKSKKPIQVKKLKNDVGLPNTFAFTAKVMNISPNGDRLVAVELALTNYTKSEWKEVYKKFEIRQEQISELFDKIRRSGKEFEEPKKTEADEKAT